MMNKKGFARAVFIVAGLVLIADTLFVLTRSNPNLGVVLPALLGAPLLLYGIFKKTLDEFFRRRAGRVIKWVFIGGYIFLAAVFGTFTAAALSASATAPARGAQAVIVLGAGIRGDQVSLSLKNRLDAAASYYAENPAAVIVVSGGYGAGKEVSEAHAMEKYLLSIDIPQSSIIKEERATTTSENFQYSKEILDGMFPEGYDSVYATNDFHILRAGMCAAAAGLEAQGISAPTPATIAPNCFMREALALLYTYAFGA